MECRQLARATDPDAARAAVREVLVLAVRTALEPLVQAGWAEEPEKKPATEAEQNRVIDAFGAQLVDLEDIVRTVDVRGIQARLAGGADDAALQTEVRRIALPGIRGTADAMAREYREIQARAKAAADQAAAAYLQSLIDLYYLREGRYPPNKVAVAALAEPPIQFQYAGNDFVHDAATGELRLLIEADRC